MIKYIAAIMIACSMAVAYADTPPISDQEYIERGMFSTLYGEDIVEEAFVSYVRENLVDATERQYMRNRAYLTDCMKLIEYRNSADAMASLTVRAYVFGYIKGKEGGHK